VLSHRFQIQDLVAQDLFGVTFCALDIATREVVAVRRFFPFGVAGGGLFDEERAAYDVAVARLAGLKHPGWRAVLTGGCDPVDGMPFVVTEWITGQALRDKLEHGVFSPAAAIRVLDRALEICEALSQLLAEEGVWVETCPSLIIEDGGDSRRGLTFSISPMKWLGGASSRRSLLPVVELANDLLGWRDMMVADQAGNGLGMWVKWLRAHAETATLFEVRQKLANFTGGTAPDPARTLVPDPARTLVPDPARTLVPDSARTLVPPPPHPVAVEKSPSKQPLWWAIGLLALLAVVAGWWLLTSAAGDAANRLAAAEPSATSPEGQSKRVEKINALAATLIKGGRLLPTAAAAADASKPGGVFQSGDTQLIINERNREVTVEGVLKNIRASDSGKTLYLEFEATTSTDGVRGAITTQDMAPGLSEQDLKQYLGKRIRITGVVKLMSRSKAQCPEVLLEDRKSIQEV
jgi:hypothetical protein